MFQFEVRVGGNPFFTSLSTVVFGDIRFRAFRAGTLSSVSLWGCLILRSITLFVVFSIHACMA